MRLLVSSRRQLIRLIVLHGRTPNHDVLNPTGWKNPMMQRFMDILSTSSSSSSAADGRTPSRNRRLRCFRGRERQHTEPHFRLPVTSAARQGISTGLWKKGMGKTGKKGRNGKRRMTERGRIEGKEKEEREACRKYDRRRENRRLVRQ